MYLFQLGHQQNQYTACFCSSPEKNEQEVSDATHTRTSSIHVFQTGNQTHVNAVSPKISSSHMWGSDVSVSDMLVHASMAFCNSSCDVGLNTAKAGTAIQAKATKKLLESNIMQSAQATPRFSYPHVSASYSTVVHEVKQFFTQRVLSAWTFVLALFCAFTFFCFFIFVLKFLYLIFCVLFLCLSFVLRT